MHPLNKVLPIAAALALVSFAAPAIHASPVSLDGQRCLCGLPKAKPKAKPVIQHTVIESVGADSITIKSASGTKEYKITKDTELQFKGKTVTIADLKAGMRVSVSVGADPAVADRISAEDPPKAEPTPAKK